MISRAILEVKAEQCGFKVTDYARGPGTRCDVALKDERTDERATIGIWPDTTELEVFSLLAHAAQQTRGSPMAGTSSDWMM